MHRLMQDCIQTGDGRRVNSLITVASVTIEVQYNFCFHLDVHFNECGQLDFELSETNLMLENRFPNHCVCTPSIQVIIIS